MDNGLWGATTRRAVSQGFALGGEFLFHVEKEPKDAKGLVPMGASAHSHCAPWNPIYGGSLLCLVVALPARKI